MEGEMRKHTITSLMLSFVLIISCFPFMGCGKSKGYVLSEDQTYYIFQGYDEFDETDYTILSEVKGLPVTEIAKNAFSGNATLTTVTIPDSITKIGYEAFSKCSELKEVTIGAGVKAIPESGFNYCQKLTTVTFSEGLEKINKSAFANCMKLDNLTFPSTLTTISEKAFYRCRTLSSVSLPENLTKIETSCFEECSGITEVTINKNLIEISNSCFKNCPKVAKINFAMDGILELIGTSAFFNASVTELTFPDSLRGIKSGAFENNKKLRKVTFGKGIEFIGGNVRSASDPLGGAFNEIISEGENDTIHITEMIFPEDAIGYGWFASLDGWGSSGTPSLPNKPENADLYFLDPDEIRNNEARVQLCQTMTGYSWFKKKTA